MTMFDDVVDLHKFFEIPLPQRPTPLDAELSSYRMTFLREELAEVEEALNDENLVALADGLADLICVALGTAALAGIPFNKVFEVVHKANLTKRRAPAELTKRGHEYDLIKPHDFVRPEDGILNIIAEASARGSSL